MISGIHKQPLFLLNSSGLIDRIGEDNVCGSIDEAIERARQIIETEVPAGKPERHATPIRKP